VFLWKILEITGSQLRLDPFFQRSALCFPSQLTKLHANAAIIESFNTFICLCHSHWPCARAHLQISQDSQFSRMQDCFVIVDNLQSCLPFAFSYGLPQTSDAAHTFFTLCGWSMVSAIMDESCIMWSFLIIILAFCMRFDT